mmetsp:Transcript_5813/g.16955  ORF Transcript_5813/g.16955 Transcript_5813/m.16955 type:complete len:203 (+) Transcript_5813:2533-3141(+)
MRRPSRLARRRPTARMRSKWRRACRGTRSRGTCSAPVHWRPDTVSRSKCVSPSRTPRPGPARGTRWPSPSTPCQSPCPPGRRARPLAGACPRPRASLCPPALSCARRRRPRCASSHLAQEVLPCACRQLRARCSHSTVPRASSRACAPRRAPRCSAPRWRITFGARPRTTTRGASNSCSGGAGCCPPASPWAWAFCQCCPTG